MKPAYIVIILLISNNIFSQTELPDPTLSNFNKVIQVNQNINTTLNQFLIYWNEAPTNIKGAKNVKETLFIHKHDSTSILDTVIYFNSGKNILSKLTKSYYDYQTLENDTSKIIVIDSSMIMYPDSLHTIVEGPKQMTYVGNRLVSENTKSEKSTYKYHIDGNLMNIDIDNLELNISSFMNLSSETYKDTTIYTLAYNQGNYKLFDPDKVNIFKIKMHKADSTDCIQYDNVVLMNRLMYAPIINKTLVICEDGKVLKDIEKKLVQSEPNIYSEYIIENGNIKEKIRKIGEDGKYFNYKTYEYDKKDRLVKIVGHYFYSVFEYDDRNNIIKRIDFSKPANGPDKIVKYWTRKIEYIE